MTYSTISVADFARKLRSGSVDLCVDVRNPDEYAACHCRGSHNIPLPDINADRVNSLAASSNLNPQKTVYLICAAGKRSQMAAEKLANDLPNPICIVTGGGVGNLSPDLHEGN